MQKVWAIPTLFGRSQRMAGSKVKSASGENGNVYFWAPFTAPGRTATCTSSSRTSMVRS